jgi:antitoxin VapB
LEAELRRETDKEPLAARIGRIADGLAAEARPHGRPMSKGEVDAMWGHD